MSDAASGRWRSRSMWLFSAASLLTIGLGAVVMARNDIGVGLWIRNPIASLVAGAFAIWFARRGWLAGIAAPIATLVIALSLVGPEQQGVHRWIGAGPVQLNAAALALPVAIAAFMRERWWLAVGSFAILAGLLAWQPDISQLSGFALAAVILCTARFGGPGAIGSFSVAAAAVALCLVRPDPLEPIAHVEGIIFVAFAETPLIAAAMALSLGLAALSPLCLWPVASARPVALALAAYFACTSAAFLVGAYPVPLAGFGVSFVVGWWLGFAALAVPELAPDRTDSLTSS